MQRSLFGVLVSPEEYKKLDSSGTDSWLRAAFRVTSLFTTVFCVIVTACREVFGPPRGVCSESRRYGKDCAFALHGPGLVYSFPNVPRSTSTTSISYR